MTVQFCLVWYAVKQSLILGMWATYRTCCGTASAGCIVWCIDNKIWRCKTSLYQRRFFHIPSEERTTILGSGCFLLFGLQKSVSSSLKIYAERVFSLDYMREFNMFEFAATANGSWATIYRGPVSITGTFLGINHGWLKCSYRANDFDVYCCRRHPFGTSGTNKIPGICCFYFSQSLFGNCWIFLVC